jgi:3-oxoacyl-[acyl-carrier protein] reductase
MIAIDLNGKRAVVTGGSRGVGRAAAQMLKQAGAQVGISYLNRKVDAAAVGADWTHACDLSIAEQADRLFDKAKAEFGSIDIFIGNAGLWNPSTVPITEMTDHQWRHTMAVNLDSIFYTTRAAVRMMNDSGRIVLISSTAGQRGEAFHADYASSKGAMISLVKGLCIELAPRQITVNCVAPGWVDTEMAALPYQDGGRERIEAGIPIGRVATAEDIAGPVVFLCSTMARHITGEIMNVNGGSVLVG